MLYGTGYWVEHEIKFYLKLAHLTAFINDLFRICKRFVGLNVSLVKYLSPKLLLHLKTGIQGILYLTFLCIPHLFTRESFGLFILLGTTYDTFFIRY